MPNTPQIRPTPAVIEVVAYPDFELLDVSGPVAVFNSANRWAVRAGKAPAPYVIRVVASASPVRSHAGVSIVADELTPLSEPIDTLMFVGGGPGADQRAREDKVLVTWFAQRVTQARRVASVCTGAFLLGHCGLLKERRVVTHWGACNRLTKSFPDANIVADAIYVEDGHVWSSAGVTAGIDLTLALVERDLGHAAAKFAARELVVFLKRPGGQAQFSTILRLQTGDDRFDQLHGWVADNLRNDLSVGALAERVGMSARSFVRHYRQVVGHTPARAIEMIRLEIARDLLSTTKLSVKRVAARCGFGSVETMRRSFLRHIAVTPQDYRRRFQNSDVEA